MTPVHNKVGCPYVRCKACLVPLCLNPFTARVLDGDFKVPLNSESVDEIQRCNHSYETSLPVLLHGAINVFNKMKFGHLVEIYFKFGSERDKSHTCKDVLQRRMKGA